jgi:hypothetical protein
MVARVEKQMPDLQSYPTSPSLMTPFQIGHADIGVMASLTVRTLHTIQRIRFQDACAMCLHLLPALRLQPVPAQTFSRKIYLATRKTELDPHAERAAQICRTVLQKIYAPSLHRLTPWMKAAFVAK